MAGEITSTRNGLVTIYTGTNCSVQTVPADLKEPIRGLNDYRVTVNPGVTTAQELRAQLDQLGIKQVKLEELEDLAGENRVIDRSELLQLDEFLDKKAALTLLEQNGIIIDPPQYLSLEKSRSIRYLRALVALQRAGVRTGFDIILCLDLEKGENYTYVATLIRLNNQGVRIRAGIITSLSIIKAGSEKYLEQLIANPDDPLKADITYVNLFTGRDFTSLTDLSQLPELYKDASADIVAEHIVLNYFRAKALSLLLEINDLHASSDTKRTALIKGLPARALYLLIVCGEEEAYASTFRLVFTELIKKMKSEGLTAIDLIERTDPHHIRFRQFLTSCALHGRLTTLIATITDSAQKTSLLRDFIQGLSGSNNLVDDTISIAELMSIETDPEILAIMEADLVNAFHSEKSPIVKKHYGIIASAYFTNHGKPVEQSLAPFYQQAATDYPIQRQTGLQQSELLNARGEIIDRQYFYDDDDGRASFRSLLTEYGQDRSWTIEHKKNYIIISKKSNKATVIIYANRPGQPEGIAEVHQVLIQRGQIPKIVDHRGHSTWVSDTIDQLDASARIVNLGSCGGRKNVKEVLDRAPNAQVIATRDEGTMQVNDPLMKTINETALAGDIDWQKTWERAEKRIPKSAQDRFHYYIPPYHNIATQIIRTLDHQDQVTQTSK